MAAETPIHPGAVDWSGENPGMYLKDEPDGPFVTLISFFRVVVSPYGRGQALVLLESPLLDTNVPEALNVCVTDNDALAHWLVAEFVSRFGAFSGATALGSMRYVPLSGSQASGDPRESYVEWIQGEGVEATLSWEDLGQPFMVTLPAQQSATGRHELWSLFVNAGRGSARVNGRDVRGRPVPREFAGRRSSRPSWRFRKPGSGRRPEDRARRGTAPRVWRRMTGSDERVSVTLDDPDHDHGDGHSKQEVNAAAKRV